MKFAAATLLLLLSCAANETPSGVLERSGLRAASPLEGESVRVMVIDRQGNTTSVDFHTAGVSPTLPTSTGWYFDTSRLPRGTSAANAEADVLWSAPDGAATYLGRTNESANVSAAIHCLERDGRSVVSFGETDSRFVGIACQWYRGETLLELDLMLDRTTTLHAVEREAGQSGQSIATLISQFHKATPLAVRIAKTRGNNHE